MCSYKLIFKQNLKEIREWGFLQRGKGRGPGGRANGKTFLTKQEEAQSKLGGVLKLN